MHKIEVPADLATIDELIVPTSYKAMSADDPAFALFVVYLQAGLVEVLPQKWFTAAQYEVGKQWITRAARDQRVAPHLRRVLRDGNLPARGRWLSAGRVVGATALALRYQILGFSVSSDNKSQPATEHLRPETCSPDLLPSVARSRPEWYTVNSLLSSTHG